ncbi:glutaryl-CoA dehydrogenase Acd [Carboxydothermus ferrireducens]|uniref:Glutaryl-CoA dehydrogenase (Non-decarboxylating) n=1 Tax=Carboxydothermus ferrireducens DSM 11255 TaxID=1119529 RepID=A0ABX2RB99_9THEO|nr:glutaryl-CoA dehydrogenase Acd [Carboxydothermus ferrireducens]NYE58442.1 glutaryl-CoA dehydrogenase (non-decarboxylating) [Carboxydothermus ferrireducens DSM 11255]
MNFDLPEDLLAIKRLAREFAEKEVKPTADADDKAHRFRRDLVQKMGELGFLGCIIPEEYGGNGQGYLAIAILCEEIARVHSSLRIIFAANTLGPGVTIYRYGTEEAKKKYLPGLVSGALIGCFAITEPNAGSDVASMTTKAIRDGDYYILNGSKMWISLAPVADIALVYAYTDPSRRAKGMSAFIVDLNSEGVTIEPIEEKLGNWASPVGAITFENVRIPGENLLGQEGQGFKICMQQLDDTRLASAAGAVGVAQACLDAAVEYANTREQFGQKVGQFQMIQDWIAQMVVEIEAARLLTYRAAFLKDKGVPNTRETSMAKLFAGETASKCADYALRIFSAYGYSEEYPVARYFRDAKYYQIVEGTSNIHKLILAQDALGYRKANRN